MSLYDYAKIDPYYDSFIPQTHGEISDSITQNWTEQALECYAIHCDCSKCSIANSNYSFVCQMPKVVEILKAVAGEPDINSI